MELRNAFERLTQHALVVLFCFSLGFTPVASFAQDAKAPADNRARKPNYDLASRWTTAKVTKLVFDTSVTPHWLESGERFWYSYETSQGKKWWMGDPAKKTNTPLFDNAKMAALFTGLTRIAYEAQHLPIPTITLLIIDTTLQLH